MFSLIRDKEREWDYIKEQQKVQRLLNTKLATVKFMLKNTDPPIEFNPIEHTESFHVFQYDPIEELPGNGLLTLYTTLNLHLEMDFEVMERPAPGQIILKPQVGRIGKFNRAYPRYPNKNDFVIANNFQISNTEIDFSNTRAQIANQVVFTEFEKRLHGTFPGLKIHDISDRNRPETTNYLKYSVKSVFVEDTSKAESYKSSDPELEDYYDFLNEAGIFESLKRRFLDEAIQSLAIVPVLYVSQNKTKTIACVCCESSSKLSRDDFKKLTEIADEILKRITGSNILTIKDKQKVINISEGGVALEVNNSELMKNLPLQKWITFDLVFRLQAPMRFNGKVVHISNRGDHLVAGVDLEGSAYTDSKKSNQERLRALIQMAVKQQSEK